ncbi:MAG: YabP/YqfC family sporulation protein [Oscillospiraceae bacterium]|nr:YabP/YqfC family sporulation protein [Oscillospiraceae bacterium]
MSGGIKAKYNETVSKFVKKKLYINTFMSLCDNTHMEIENCRKILEYNDIYVKIQTSTLTVSIWGENIRISDYNNEGIVVDGKFSSIEFE